MVRPEVLMTRCITTTASSGDGRSLRSVMNRPTMKRLPQSVYQMMSCPTNITLYLKRARIPGHTICIHPVWIWCQVGFKPTCNQG
jgi:hypothetical protein